MRNSALLFFLCLATMALCAAGRPETATALPLPGGRIHVAPTGEVSLQEEPDAARKGRWQRRSLLQGTFVFAQNRTRARMEAAGFVLKHEIPLGRKNRPALLMLWEKAERRVMVLLRRLELHQTECLEGEVVSSEERQNGK